MPDRWMGGFGVWQKAFGYFIYTRALKMTAFNNAPHLYRIFWKQGKDSALDVSSLDEVIYSLKSRLWASSRGTDL